MENTRKVFLRFHILLVSVIALLFFPRVSFGEVFPKFLTLPFEKSPYYLEAGWYYNSGIYHGGINYCWDSNCSNSSKDTPVIAAADGIAFGSCQPDSNGACQPDSTGGEDNYGKFVLIQHSNGFTTLYTHLNGYAANIKIYSDNQRWNTDYTNWTQVRRGEVIGYAGDSGGTPFVHLHFEAANNSSNYTTHVNNRVDPYDLYKSATYYPPNSRYTNSGPNHLWTSDPPITSQEILPEIRTTLTNGTKDGSASITLDPYGAFGSYTNAGEAIYDPIGPIGAASTTYQSALFFSPVGFFLNRGGPYGSNFGGSIYDGGFTSISATEAKSVFSIQGFDFELTQTLGPKGPGGSTLTQTYRITNNTGATQNFDLIRHVDGDLYFDETLIDSGGASADGRTIFEFDSADNPNNPSTFVGISNEGGEGLGFHIGYRIAPYMFTDNIIRFGADVLNNSIAGDSNGDRIIDRPYDVTLSLGNRFSNIASGQTVAFTTKTILGSGSPIARAALPTGFIPAQENNDTINQGETRWQRFFNNIIQELRIILGFGSEFNLRVYQPDGTLFQERQSTIAPIEVVIPNAQVGEWQFEITAVNVPIPNDPFVLVVGVPDTDEDGIPDQDDNCPNTANPSQTDTDGDGIGDSCEADSDSDGWIDDVDNCPNVPNPDQTDSNANGIGDACEINPGDLNNDGLINTADYQIFRTTLGKCTGTTGFIPEADYDGDGCVTYADYRIWYGYYKNQ